ncbi:hypothetical protein HB779_22810 (plasmid) [Phyllobacterium sp. 628]|uniref:hypothetical protein n=1 Tax=Phyllobacterium sp. 628 TaxID=2718938 RepID=UPI001662519C|nr:hypothetical protein [Phyllobacterium sp. 628]QND54742.1 hypothetical protein HB779_22810 [Phyllobacterium sp. 628]
MSARCAGSALLLLENHVIAVEAEHVIAGMPQADSLLSRSAGIAIMIVSAGGMC